MPWLHFYIDLYFPTRIIPWKRIYKKIYYSKNVVTQHKTSFLTCSGVLKQLRSFSSSRNGLLCSQMNPYTSLGYCKTLSCTHWGAIPRSHNNMSISQAEQQGRFSAWLFIKSQLTKSKALSHKQCISLWYALCITAEDEIEYVIKLCFLEGNCRMNNL